MNLHISEIMSDVIEPMVDRVRGGKELISPETGAIRGLGQQQHHDLS